MVGFFLTNQWFDVKGLLVKVQPFDLKCHIIVYYLTVDIEIGFNFKKLSWQNLIPCF